MAAEPHAPSVAPAAPPTAALHRVAAALLGGGVAIALAAAVAVGAFALPAFDDFMRATRRGRSAADLGWWGYVFGFTYRRWQGRWASCGLEAAVLPHVDPTRYYPLLIGAVAIVNAAGAYVVCRAVARRGSPRLAATMTVAGLALLWAGMPSLAEAVYWFVGAVENMLPLALASAVLATLATARPRAATMVALALVAFVTCGLHELYGAMLCLTLCVGTAAAFRAGSACRYAWLGVTLAAMVGLAVVVLAPGNRVRLAAEGHPQDRHAARAVLLAVRQFWDYSRPWLLDPKLIAATLWVALSPALESARVPWPSAQTVPWRIVVPATWIALLAIGFGLPSWAFAAEMPERTLSGNYVVFVAGWLLSVYVWTRPLASDPAADGAWRAVRSPGVADAAALLLGASLLGGNTIFSAGEDLAHRLRPWHAAAERRYAQLRRSAGTDAVVPRLPALPYLLLGGETVDDPADYLNRGPVAFFRLRRLTLAPLGHPRPTDALPAVAPTPPGE